MVSVTS